MRTLRISLVDTCNYKCTFCHNEGLVSGESLSRFTSDMMHIIACAAIQTNVNKITISGGEPLLNKNIISIIDSITMASPQIQINMATNLALAKPELIKNIAPKIQQFNINFQAISDTAFQNMTKTKKLNKVLENISLLKKSGAQTISLNYVYTPQNDKELLPIIQFAQKENLRLKILEVIIDQYNRHTHKETKSLIETLKKCGYENCKYIGKSDQHFIHPQNKHGIRVIHSYCNTRDEVACVQHAEIRISPDLELRPCMHSNLNSISIKQEVLAGDVNSVAYKIEESFKGEYKTCPKQDASVAIIKHQDNLIMVERQTTTSSEKTLETPGGKIEMGETPEQAVIREVKEEANLDVHIIKRINTFYNSRTTHYFECALTDEAQLIDNQLVKIIPLENLDTIKITDFAIPTLKKIGLLTS